MSDPTTDYKRRPWGVTPIIAHRGPSIGLFFVRLGADFRGWLMVDGRFAALVRSWLTGGNGFVNRESVRIVGVV